MIDTNGSHGNASFWLEVVDRLIKFLALLVGAAWTWMHYMRSRTYAQKLQLEVEAKVFRRSDLYIEAVVGLQNAGASKHVFRQQGASITIWAVMDDLSESHLHSKNVFQTDHPIEPGESIYDSKVFEIQDALENIVWLKLELRVESADREWYLTRHVRVEIVNQRGDHESDLYRKAHS